MNETFKPIKLPPLREDITLNEVAAFIGRRGSEKLTLALAEHLHRRLIFDHTKIGQREAHQALSILFRTAQGGKPYGEDYPKPKEAA